MKKKILSFAPLFLGCLPILFAQTVAYVNINKTNINLRGNSVVLGQVTLNAPANGKVILRFDGHCASTYGDRIIVAASETTKWTTNDGCVEFEAPEGGDVVNNSFSHTRSYGVDSGEKTFYAVAENAVEMEGTGIASIYGTLTAEWFPMPSAGKAFAEHKGFYYEDILVEGGPTAFNSLTIDAPVAGKVLVRFDGKCVSSYGDLMFFAASNTPDWSDYDGSSSNEVIDDDLNRFSFAHVRSYDVGPGSHTFYAVVENYYETYGNGFASIYGSLTVQFYPEPSITKPVFQTLSTPFGIKIDGPPVAVGELTINAPVEGKVELNFTGTCIANFGDQVRLAASDGLNWAPNDGNITFEPYSSDLNRVSFSHTRVYDVAPGDHQFYAVVQNYEEYDGGGLAVVYGSLTARYFPEGIIQTTEPAAFKQLKVSPNPASDFIRMEFTELAQEAFSLTLSDLQGKTIRSFEKLASEPITRLEWRVSNLPSGTYLVTFTNADGTASRQIIRP